MAYPSSHSGSSFSGTGLGGSPAHSGSAPSGLAEAAALSRTPRCPGAPASAGPVPPARTSEGEHQLEKLEFALAVAVTRGDSSRIQCLREQIAALGGNCEEPGT